MNTEQERYEDFQLEGISLKEIFDILWMNKWLLIIITAIGLVLGFASGMVINSTTSKVSTYVELQWNGITSGEYPDGLRFDYNNAFESYVLNESLDSMNLNEISSSELRSAISLTPVIPSSTLALIQSSLEKGTQITYYATQFKVTLDNNALDLSVNQGIDLINLLLDNFRIDFERKYIQRAVIIDYTSTDLMGLDYIEAYDILNSQILLINNAIESVLPDAASFSSTQLGIGFGDIQVRANLVNSIDLSTMSARINNYLLSKDKDLLITKYLYQVEQMELLLNTEIEVETGLTNLIDNYVGSTATILIPGLDSNTIDTDPYLNILYGNLVSSQREIATYEQTIISYETNIERLRGLDPLFIVTPQKEAEEIVKVQESIARSSQTLSAIVDDLDILFTEYNVYVTRSMVKPLMAPQYEPEINLLITGAIGLVLGGGIGLVTVFIVHYKKVNKDKNTALDPIKS
ncbi:MAG: hypothetical protein K9L02_05670 [Acholeplasmataceae bacterium]|nr:hypothetical protein [Acholeplasmataceae bacterium]